MGGSVPGLILRDPESGPRRLHFGDPLDTTVFARIGLSYINLVIGGPEFQAPSVSGMNIQVHFAEMQVNRADSITRSLGVEKPLTMYTQHVQAAR
jgi:hypothetical protein